MSNPTRTEEPERAGLHRRDFIVGLGMAAGGAALAGPLLAQGTPAPARKRNVKLGFDNFSVRAFGWKAPQLLDHAASLRLDTVLISDLHAYESLDEKHLREVKAKADGLGVEIHAGTGGVCPTSRRAQKEFGSPEEHLQLLIRVAKALGSPVARCYLGSMEDRKGGIERHIESMVKILKTVRSQAVDAGVKIAVENHAGDLQAWELAGLVEAAGKDFVGVTVDSGNATWTLEDPINNLRILGPHAVTSGIRDSMVWEEGSGAKVQWTAVGEGCVDMKAYMDEYEKLCPRAPVQLEIISGFARPFPYCEQSFWEDYPKARASEFAAFVALAKKGKPLPSFKAPPGSDPKEAEKAYQKDELERSVRYCRETLGLGLK